MNFETRAQRGGLNHRTRLEANKMVWAGGDGQLWSCDHRGTSGTEWVNFHCHPTLEFELTWLLYTQGWHQAHTCYHTLRCCRGSVSMVTQSPHTTDIPLPPSPPQERVPTALGVSELHTLFIYSGLMWQCKGDNCSKSSFCSPSPKLQLPVPSTHP